MATAEYPDFHSAVQLLLARMETDPEEFYEESYRWTGLLAQLREWASPEEVSVLNEKYRMIRMNEVHVNIMKKLTHADEPDDFGIAQGATGKVPYPAPTLTQQLQLQNKQNAMQLALQAQHDKMWQDQLNGLPQTYGVDLANRTPRPMPSYEEVMKAQRPKLSRLMGLGGYPAKPSTKNES